MTWRFSSTTSISSKPSAKWRTVSASSGQGIPTLSSRKPISAASASSRPKASRACRTSGWLLPVVTMPQRGRGESITTRFRPLRRAYAIAAYTL